MKKPTLNAWSLDLAKNLGSKAGTAYLTFGSTYLLLQAFITELAKIPAGVKTIDPNSTAGVLMRMLEQLTKGASDSLNGWVAWALLLVLAAFGVAVVAGLQFESEKPKSKFAKLMYDFAHRRVILGKAVDFFLGKLVVPFTVICTTMYELPTHFATIDKARAITYAIVIVGFIIGAHFFTFFGQQPTGTVIFTIAAPKAAHGHEAAMTNWLAKAVEEFPFVGNAEVQSESTDGTICVVLPIRYPADKWKNTEATVFVTKLRNAREHWEAHGYQTASCFIPESIRRRIPVELRNTAPEEVQ